jgi:hypothetical protein
MIGWPGERNYDLNDTVSHENSEVFEKSDEGLRAEVLQKRDYNLLSEV